MPPEAAPVVTEVPAVEVVADAPNDSIEGLLNAALDEQPEAPAEKSKEGEPDKPAAPEPEAVELSDAALEKALATPEGRKAAIKSIRQAEAANRKKLISLRGWENKLRGKVNAHNAEKRAFAQIREQFMGDLNIAATGTTEEALNALTRIRAGAAQSGSDFLTEVNLAVAKNGRKAAPDPEVAKLRAEVTELKNGKAKEQESERAAAHQAAYNRRLNELGSMVAAATNPTCADLARSNGDTLTQMAVSYKEAYYDAHQAELPDADAGKLVERDLAQLRAFPSTLAYARLGNLGTIVRSVQNLAKTEGLDDAAALGRIEAELRSHFGAPPSQEAAGRAPSAKAEPENRPPMPGRSPSARASSTGAMRAPTPEEDVEQFSDLFAALGM